MIVGLAQAEDAARAKNDKRPTRETLPNLSTIDDQIPTHILNLPRSELLR